MLNIRRQAGDTIVEVLLAIVVVSAVLTGAYVSSNRSLNTTIQSRERNEAVKIAQSQIELLRASLQGRAPSAAQDPKQQTNLFCLNSGNPVTLTALSVSTMTTILDTSIYSAPCIHDINDNTPVSVGIPYYISIKRNPSGTDANLYRINVRWYRVGGDSNDQVRFMYRVYRP
jgi:type II secretory pathway pseudopilin PulG